MAKTKLEQQVESYELWKKHLIETVDRYRTWLQKSRLGTPTAEKQIRECLSALDSEHLSITFVAEFSRGKTELINAIFFADYGRRLLPSTAGRTTMCPTEMFWDKKVNRAYIRLLPIETRLEDASLSELKRDHRKWTIHLLDPNSIDQIESTLKEVVATRPAPREEAIRLGLYDEQLYSNDAKPPAQVDIPKWRHAIISFPHRLLQKGLSILDTPGLNALGSEPELTLNMLPSSQAILFLLAADTGVTKSDLDMWQSHIRNFHSNRKKGLMVVLNKIDTLWDELSTPSAIDDTVRRQVATTAKILGIDESVVFPVSAQKGLLAKIRRDDALLTRSRLLSLEEYLSRDLLESRQKIVQETIISGIGNMVENSYGIVASKLNRIKTQIDELKQLSGKSNDVIEHMMKETRKEQAAYMKNVNSFQASHKVLQEQSSQLRKTLDLKQLEERIEETKKAMEGNWTTHGLKVNMQMLFDYMRSQMHAAVEQSESIRKLIRSIYRHFQNEHGFTVAQPKMLSMMRYRVSLELLHQEAEAFRKSPVMAMTEKHFVLRRFINAMVIQARDLFDHAGQDVDNWLKSSMEPLIYQIRDHKDHMEQHLKDLQKISQSKETLTKRMAELQKQYNAITRQLTALRNMHNTLTDTQSPLGGQSIKPKVVDPKGPSRSPST